MLETGRFNIGGVSVDDDDDFIHHKVEESQGSRAYLAGPFNNTVVHGFNNLVKKIYACIFVGFNSLSPEDNMGCHSLIEHGQQFHIGPGNGVVPSSQYLNQCCLISSRLFHRKSSRHLLLICARNFQLHLQLGPLRSLY